LGKVHKTPTMLQMEATECGAASLGIVLAHYGRYAPLEKLRELCGVSRDGSKASNVLKAARKYRCAAKGFRMEPAALEGADGPMIVHWNFNHFLVLEGIKRKKAFLNDPAVGRRVVTLEEFDEAFTGVVLRVRPGEGFRAGGPKPNAIAGIKKRIKGAEKAVLFLVLASLALVIPGLIVPTLSRVFVDDILIKGKSDWLRPLLLGMAFTALMRGGLTWLKERYLLLFFTKLSVVSSAKFLWHVLRLPVPFFMARYAGDIGERVRLNDRVAGLLSGQLAETGLDLVMIVFYGALLMSYDVGLTLVGIAIATVNVVVLRVLSRKRVDDNMALQQESGKLVGVAMSGLQVIETIKASGEESDFFAKWSGHWAKFQNKTQELGRSSLILSATPGFLSSINNAAILTLGGLRVMEGDMTVGMLVAYQTLMSSFMEPVNGLVDLGTTLQEAEADMKRLDDVLGHQVAEDAAIDDTATAPTPERKLVGYVHLEGLAFGYTPYAPPLLQNFDLALAPGARVALVGGSGSGKSTVAKLVAGLYQPWAGDIKLDGQQRGALSRTLINHSVAMVDQDISLFEGTIRENLTLWDPSVPDADIVQAAMDAEIHDDVSARSGGYDAKVEEGGRNFSGGQRQRLEIARALVRNPTILLLDEATSALDPRTEKRIDDNLRRRGCTCMIIAHRLSTIRDCDEIVVLDEGEVVQRGTHTQLMKEEGRYAQLMGAA